MSQPFQGHGFRPLLHSIKMFEDINKIKKHSKDVGRILLVGRTQNPRAYLFNARQLGMFPQPNGYIDPTIRKVGKKIVEGLYRENCLGENKEVLFDETCFIERNAYQSITNISRYGAYPGGIPYCRDREINSYMDKHINWENGDALIQIGYYREDIMDHMLETAKQRMGFYGISEVALEEISPVLAS